jgi:gas vesicle protein
MALKNLCKTVRLVVAAVAVGETIASYYKDENFRKSLNEAKGFDKCKVIFNNLVDVNKRFFTEVKSVDYNSLAEKYKQLFQDKVNFVGSKLEEVKKEVEKLHDEKLKPVVEELTEKYEELKKVALEKKDELSEKYQDKLELIEEKINEVKKQIKEKMNK